MDTFFEQFEEIDPEIHGIRLPKFKLDEEDRKNLNLPELTSSLELFRLLVQKGFNKRCKEDILATDKEPYAERLKYEMSVIEPTDFVDYLLMVWDVVNIAKKHRIAVGPGRGSAASSLVNYSLGITNVDPVKYGLYFERFLSEARTTPTIVDGVKYYSDAADIDLDIEDSRRDELISILKEKYKGNFCKLSTLSTLQSRKCIKEVCKIALGYNEEKSLEISAMVPALHGKIFALKQTVAEVPEFAKFAEDHPVEFKIALKLSELVFGKGSHASAYIVSYNPLLKTIPCEMGEGEMVTSFDMNYAQLNNIKLDLLGLKAIGIINQVCGDLNLNPNHFDLNEETVFKYLQDVKHPYGLFQISGDCNLRVVNKVKPKNLDHLAAVTALARPGALQFVDRYASFVNEGKNESTHPFFDEVLSPTAGLALYQESCMQMCEKIGLTKADSETIRKVIGKKLTKKVKEWESKIFDVAEKNGLKKEIAEVLWKILDDSSKYSFNRSHSVSYGTIAAQTVYLKYKYPQHFFLACLKIASSRGDFLEQFHEIQQELHHFGIKLLPPNVANKAVDFTVEGKDIRFGLGEIKGVSEKSLNKLREFLDVQVNSDLQVYSAAKDAKLSIGIVSALIQSGALGHSIYERAEKVLEAQIWNLLTPKEKFYCLENEKDYNGDLIAMLKKYLEWKNKDGKTFTKQSRLETIRKNADRYFQIYNLNKDHELLACYYYETMLLGFSYSVTLKDIYGDKKENLRNLDEIDKYVKTKGSYELMATIQEVVSAKSKNGNKYLKMKVSDEKKSSYVMLLGDKLAKYLDKFEEPKEGDIVYIVGQKGDDILWVNWMEIQNHKVYTKLSELKNITNE